MVDDLMLLIGLAAIARIECKDLGRVRRIRNVSVRHLLKKRESEPARGSSWQCVLDPVLCGSRVFRPSDSERLLSQKQCTTGDRELGKHPIPTQWTLPNLEVEFVGGNINRTIPTSALFNHVSQVIATSHPLVQPSIYTVMQLGVIGVQRV